MIDPQVLDTSEGFHTALSAIERVCHRGDTEIAEMISTLMSRSHILEYLISGAFNVPVHPRTLSAHFVFSGG